MEYENVLFFGLSVGFLFGYFVGLALWRTFDRSLRKQSTSVADDLAEKLSQRVGQHLDVIG